MAVLGVEGNYLAITHGSNTRYYPAQTLTVSAVGDDVLIESINQGHSNAPRILRENYTNITGASISGATAELMAASIVELIRGIDVSLQDQTTQAVIAHFSNVSATTTTATAVNIGDVILPVVDTTGIVAGQYLVVFNPILNRFSPFHVLSVAGGPTHEVTLDTPFDVAYPSGSFVDAGSHDLAVDGSITPVTYGIRNATGNPIGLTVDITRVLITCLTDSAAQLNLFGDIAALTNGLVCRKRDGDYFNIFNVKSNQDIAGLGYDFNVITAVGQGQDGFLSRITFAGQSKMGVVQRLAPYEDLEFIVQDNLAALSALHIVAEGHIVE
jgi:hypothetical protein